MTPEIKIIYQLCQKEIFEVTTKTESDMKAWMATGNFLLKNPLIPHSGSRNNAFTLQVNYWGNIYPSLANDCNRFAQAAIESMWLVRKDKKIPKSTGWALVQMYYSSFYAAHAIMRLFGWCCTQLEREHVRKVYDIAIATSQDGGVQSIENGFYLSKMDTFNHCIEYKKLKDSHADTWSSFYNLLNWLFDKIPDNTTGIGEHKLDAMTLISNTKTMISRDGSSRGNWPSRIRNKIHYHHSYGVWFPYKEAIHVQEDVMKNMQWIKSPLSFDCDVKNDDVYALYNASNSILSIMFHLMKYGFEHADKVSSPLANGTFRLVNQIQAV